MYFFSESVTFTYVPNSGRCLRFALEPLTNSTVYMAGQHSGKHTPNSLTQDTAAGRRRRRHTPASPPRGVPRGIDQL